MGGLTVRARFEAIHSRTVDSLFILAPPWVITLLVLLYLHLHPDAVLAPVAWLVLIVGFDVAHVYSTIFRTYLDEHERRRRGDLLILVPLVSWCAGMVLHALSPAAFWTVLAYLAVFHFVRQQYGLMMLYPDAGVARTAANVAVEKIAIYAATVYPVVYWHAHLPRNFSWFVSGDFIPLAPWIDLPARVVYVLVLVVFSVQLVLKSVRSGSFNLPRALVLAGTAFSWLAAIVLTDSDLAFTTINVVSHAMPYFALVFIFAANRRRLDQLDAARSGISSGIVWLLLAVATVVGLAWIEEGFWDGLVWSEHAALFGPFAALPRIEDPTALALLVPLLAVPQVTHYIMDAYLWRMSEHPQWQSVLFLRRMAAQ